MIDLGGRFFDASRSLAHWDHVHHEKTNSQSHFDDMSRRQYDGGISLLASPSSEWHVVAPRRWRSACQEVKAVVRLMPETIDSVLRSHWLLSG